MSAAFHLPSITPSEVSSSSTPAQRYSSDNYSDDDIDTLPYPAELRRTDFLQPDFDPQTYLSTLRNRHQTLEDLRTDLRQRSQLLNKELLDLVNANYEEFLSLGSDLRGGEEKVEGVRVGVLGFKREVDGIKKHVKDRADEARGLVLEKKSIRRDTVLARSLLEVYERIGELEQSLGITDGADEEDDDYEDDEDDEEEDEDEMRNDVLRGVPAGMNLKKLQRHVQRYLLIQKMSERIGKDHPFLMEQKSRLQEIRKMMLLDLAGLRQARESPEGVLAVNQIYLDLDAEAEGLKALKKG